MRLFCECDNEWVIAISDLDRRNIIPLGQTHECHKCKFYKWNDADYENTMHDLKSMNEM